MKRRSPQVVSGLSVSAVLERLPLPVSKRLGLQPCLGCAVAPFETLAEAARILGLDRRRLCASVEAALANAEAR